MRTCPILVLPQLSDDQWRKLTADSPAPEDPIDRILRENQLSMEEVLSIGETA